MGCVAKLLLGGLGGKVISHIRQQNSIGGKTHRGVRLLRGFQRMIQIDEWDLPLHGESLQRQGELLQVAIVFAGIGKRRTKIFVIRRRHDHKPGLERAEGFDQPVIIPQEVRQRLRAVEGFVHAIGEKNERWFLSLRFLFETRQSLRDLEAGRACAAANRIAAPAHVAKSQRAIRKSALQPRLEMSLPLIVLDIAGADEENAFPVVQGQGLAPLTRRIGRAFSEAKCQAASNRDREKSFHEIR